MITFFTDPHLGLNRVSHTTVTSRRKLRDALYAQAIQAAQHPSNVVCLGDLFDEFEVDNHTLMQGLEVFRQCSYVLSGNHDSSNRANALSTLSCIQSIEDRISSGIEQRLIGNHTITAINHCLTQELFEEALQEAYHLSGDFLLLHCNYDMPFTEGSASTLSLAREDAEQLLSKYKYILIGHEHNHREDFDGRLKVLGNIHPTSFSDISDKYVHQYNGGEWEKFCVWEKAAHFTSVDWREALDIAHDELQFIDVTGDYEQNEAAEIARVIQALWSKCENAYMIRNSTSATEGECLRCDDAITTEDIPTRITRSLQDSDLLELWQQYLERT